MKEKSDIIEFFKVNQWNLIIPLLITILALSLQNQLYGVFDEKSYVGINLMIEICIIIVSFTIAIQAWLIFPYTLSNRRLFIGALFQFLGLLEIAHTFSFKGMPFFIEESSTYSATWFYIISRVTQALGLFLIFKLAIKQTNVSVK